jgi:hypothetical protein
LTTSGAGDLAKPVDAEPLRVSSNLGSVGQRKPGHRRPFALVDEATQPLDELVETGPARRRTPRGAPAPSSRDNARCRGQAWRRFDAYRRVHEVGTVGEQRSRARPHAGAASVRPACPVETPHGGGTRTLPSWRPPQQRSGRAQHHGSLRRADPHRRDRRCDSVPRELKDKQCSSRENWPISSRSQA